MITQLVFYQIILVSKKVIDFSKKQALDAYPTAIQQINFTGNLDRKEDAFVFSMIEETKETVLDFLQETVRVL